MVEDALVALQLHFEGQYGKLELPGLRRKKRKRDQIGPEPKEEVAVEVEEEWLGLDNDPVATTEPTVVTFTEIEGDVEEAPITASRSFLV